MRGRNGDEGVNQPRPDKKQERGLGCVFCSPSLSLFPSQSLNHSVCCLLLGSLCLQLVTFAVSSRSQDEDEIGAVAWSAGAGNPSSQDYQMPIF